MKISRFNEARIAKIDSIIGEEIIPVEVNVIFRVNKSAGYKNGNELYSLSAKIEGIKNLEFVYDKDAKGSYVKYKGFVLLGSKLTAEELGNEKIRFLAKFSNFYKDVNKYNL